MRNMSFYATLEPMRQKTKTVTRRLGWKVLKKGDVIQPCVKCQGLKKGEKIEKLGGPIKIISVREEPLYKITKNDVIKEGFPHLTVQEFVDFFCGINKCTPETMVTRIQFRYTTD